MSVGERIKQRRLELGMTLADVGKSAKVSQSTIQRYEAGIISLTNHNTIVAIAEALHTTPEYILGITDRPRRYTGLKTVPILGDIACGQPGCIGVDEGETVSIPDDVCADFCVKCKGESMIGVGIYPGDMVFIHSQPDVEDGEIAAVCIGEETTLKRVYRPVRGVLMLHAENENMEDIVLKGQQLEEVRILGKLVSMMRMF